jgi:hypothetical protein
MAAGRLGREVKQEGKEGNQRKCRKKPHGSARRARAAPPGNLSCRLSHLAQDHSGDTSGDESEKAIISNITNILQEFIRKMNQPDPFE